MVKKRNIFLVYLYWFITFGIYGIYWLVSTKNEMNEKGAKIPTAWLMIIPIANIYWGYKYCQGFAVNIKKDNNTWIWFILYALVGIVIPLIFQLELNKLAEGSAVASTAPAAKPATKPAAKVATKPAAKAVAPAAA